MRMGHRLLLIIGLAAGGCVVEFPARTVASSDAAGGTDGPTSRLDGTPGDATPRDATDDARSPRLDGGNDSGHADALPSEDLGPAPGDARADAIVPDGSLPDARTPDASTPAPDGDGDGVPDSMDNCPAAENPDQRDTDVDLVGDVCDPCPTTGDPTDADGDGVRRCENDCDDTDPEVSPGRMERCNGRDDDCSGGIDEPFEASLGAGCAVGSGRCERFGTLVCAADGLLATCDAMPGAPEAEVCNGQDDDCDGSLDEGLAGCCTPGDVQVCGSSVGECRPGLQTCDAERRWSECDAAPAGTEACNGLDDDCDGSIDEGVLNPCGACGPVPPDVCDGLDNDCDGRIDPDYAVDEACAVGTGACRRAGFVVCTPAGDAACSAREGVPAEEVCNLLDDDCDGETDEGLLDIGPCSVGVGACRSEGRLSCAGGQTFCAAVPGAPGVETCNDLDDDCDGSTDEGFGIGEPCEVGQSLCLNRGEIVCDGQGGVRCSVEALPPQPEVCNGLDDDCDLEPDDDADCTDFVLSKCRAWLVWADDNQVGALSETWDRCPAQFEDEDGSVRCVATGPLAGGVGAGFWDIHPTGDVNQDDRLGIRFSCADPGGLPDLAAWFQRRCEIFLGWADNRGGAPANSPTWGPCPAAAGGDLGAQRCVSSGGDGQFHSMLLGGLVDDNDDFGIAFICRDPEAPRRAAAAQGSVAYWLALDRDGLPIRDAATTWNECPASAVDNDGDERCASTAGDGLFHGFRGRNGPSSSWSFGIGVSPR